MTIYVHVYMALGAVAGLGRLGPDYWYQLWQHIYSHIPVTHIVRVASLPLLFPRVLVPQHIEARWTAEDYL